LTAKRSHTTTRGRPPAGGPAALRHRFSKLKAFPSIHGDDRLSFPDLEVHRPEGSVYPALDRAQGRTFIYVNDVERRDYQFEISRSAAGANTLVIIPTGLGKTFIAAILILNFYRWFPTGKIIFVASTRPLVRQQMRFIQNSTRISSSDVHEMTGVIDAAARQAIWASGHVFFATAQTVQNDIETRACPASKVVLLVIDEAHNARGDHSYCKIVRAVASVTRFFRVLALTATPGRSFEDIQKVIYNLLIERIEFRSREDCAEYVHNRDLRSLVVPDAPGVAELTARLNAVMQVYLRALLRQSVVAHMDPSRTSRGGLVKVSTAGMGGPVRTAHARAIKLCNLREKLQCFSVPVFVSALQKFMRSADATHDDETDRLFQILQTARLLSQDDPRLTKLAEIVTDFLRGSDGSKVIVYCSYRAIVETIVAALNAASSEVRSAAFTGQAKSSDSRGQNQGQQLRVLDDFRQGFYNVLLATSIGEEGLDICEVDLIICYDVQKSPIRTIQRMGRTGRHRDGHVLFMLSESTRNALKEAECATDALANLIARRRSDFEYFRCGSIMNPESFEIIFKEVMPEPVDGPQVRKESNGATLLQSERELMASRYGPLLRHRGFSLAAHLEFQTSETSLTNITFSAESRILGELVSSIAQSSKFSVNRDLFAVESSSSSRMQLSIPTPPRCCRVVSLSGTDDEESAAGSFHVGKLLGIDLSSSSSDRFDRFIVHSSQATQPVERLRKVADLDRTSSSSESGEGRKDMEFSSDLEMEQRNESDDSIYDSGETSSFVSDSSAVISEASEREEEETDADIMAVEPPKVERPKNDLSSSDFDFPDSTESGKR
jgi:Fanconi anemia group M protein